ncbi:adenylyltransferase/cytidyltransferase family protein [Candidatus Woesearchaeota archaeon]|nr:adenylyltransferase/cytidyltransferase family protein [Candidatus Woesearchaeota archaeon]
MKTAHKPKKNGKRKKVVMAFGAFDGVHYGHIYYLRQAKKFGYLIVAIARDESQWRFKRMYNLPESERKKLVESLGIADRVILGSTKDALERVMEVKPDIIALTDYHPVDKRLLQAELREKGEMTKVVNIPIYKKSVYDVHHGIKRRFRRKELLGLPPRK